MRLALHAADHRKSLAEIRLRLSRRMHQRNEHLTATLGRGTQVILHDRVAARELMLFS
jgi:hypothetical protein